MVRKTKATARKTAWILGLFMVFSLLMGSPQLEVMAQETGTTFTNPREITVNLTFPNSADAEWIEGIFIGGFDNGNKVSDGKVTVEKSSTYFITIQCAFGKTVDSVKINGAQMEISDKTDKVSFMCQDADVYNIEIALGGGTPTIAWDNTGSLGDDAKIENGKVEIVAVAGITDMNAANGGLYAVQPGTPVTIRLIPDYGYQLKSTDLNGVTVAAGSEVNTFTFTMPNTNLHLAALFEKTEDRIDCTRSTVVSNASIVNGGNAASSGNLSLTVRDNASYNTDVTGAVSGTEVVKVASLDLTLENIVGKGDGTCWEVPVTEFANDINVGLTLDLGAPGAGETYSVVRDHNGVLTELATTYDAATKVLTFSTNQFSTYTIVKKNVPDTSTGNTDTSSDNTSSGSTQTTNDTSSDNTSSGSMQTTNDTSSNNASSGSTQTTADSSNNLTSPKTGEGTNMLLWILIGLTSVGMTIGAIACRRRGAFRK